MYWKRRVSDAENRLTVLYCVGALKQVTSAQLWQFLCELNTMDYMTAMLLLSELIASGELDEGAHALKGLVFLSDKGRHTLTLFVERIPKSVRDTIDSRVPAYRSQFLKRRNVTAVYESAQVGDYRLLLRLIEGDVPALEMRLHTGKRRLAARVKAKFDATAPAIIGALYQLASESTEGDAPEGSVTQLSLSEFRVGATLTPAPATELSFSILLPTQDSAASLAKAIKKAPAALGERLLGLLKG